MEEVKSAFKILTGTPTGKRPLGRTRRSWEDNIRMDLKEISINTRNWVDSAQDKDYWRVLLNVTLNLRVKISPLICSKKENSGELVTWIKTCFVYQHYGRLVRLLWRDGENV